LLYEYRKYSLHSLKANIQQFSEHNCSPNICTISFKDIPLVIPKQGIFGPEYNTQAPGYISSH
jgi:hypothetical protein